MSPSSMPTAALLLVIIAWIVTVVVVSSLIYLIVRAVLGKTDPQSLPEVLRALSPMLYGLARTLAKLPMGLPGNEVPPPSAPTMQTGDTSAELHEKTS